MRKSILGYLLVLTIFIVALPNAFSTDIDYNVILKDHGDAIVVVSLEGKGMIDLPLPIDADPAVKGAIYVQSPNGIELDVGEITSVVVYKTNLYTAKQENWLFEADLTNATSIIVTMPDNVEILDSDPNGAISTSQGLQVSWKNKNHVSVIYRFKDGTTTETDSSSIVPTLITTLVIVLIILIIVLIYFVMKKPSSKPKLEEDSKKDHIIKTLNPNEARVVRTLLDNKGSMRRNELERTSKLSKSSLFVALTNLEKKNIVGIDKTNTVHFIQLTEWFKGL